MVKANRQSDKEMLQELQEHKKAVSDKDVQFFESCFRSIRDGFIKIGERLNHEANEGSAPYFAALMRWLKDRGWKKCDIEVAMKAARKRPDGEPEIIPELFFDMVDNSKLEHIEYETQKALVSDQEFPVLCYDEKTKEFSPKSKTYRSMNLAEKNRLLGPKGGRILTIIQQELNLSKKHNNGTLQLQGVRVGDDGVLELGFQTKTCRLPLDNFTFLMNEADRKKMIDSCLHAKPVPQARIAKRKLAMAEAAA